jgi:WD40 repeat protein
MTGALVGAVVSLSTFLAAAAPPPEKTREELIALVAAAFPPAPKDFVRWTTEQQDFARAVQAALAEEDFATLERLAAEARNDTSTFPDGRYKIRDLHEGLNYPSDKRLLPIERCVEKCRRWFAAKPDSITARTALIRVQIRHAWEARGTGFADKVTPEGGRSFEERLKPVGELVQTADPTKIDDPFFYAAAIENAKVNGGTAEQVDGWMKEAAKSKQLIAETFGDGAEYFLPRWHGSTDDLTEYALNVYEATRRRCGAEMYAEVVSRVRNYHGRSTFDDFPFSWSLVVEGFCSKAQRKPNSLETAGKLGRLAWYRGDRELAAVIYHHSTDNYSTAAFKSGDMYDDFSRWARRRPELIGKSIFESADTPRECAWDPTLNRIWFTHPKGISFVDLDRGTIEEFMEMPEAHALAQSRDGRHLAVAAKSGEVILVDFKTKTTDVLREADTTFDLLDLEFLADGTTLAARRLSDRTLLLRWNYADKKLLSETDMQTISRWRDMGSVSPDGAWWAGHSSGAAYIGKVFPGKIGRPEFRKLSDNAAAVDAADLQLPQKTYPEVVGALSRFTAFSPDSRYAAFSHESTFYLVDLTSPTPFRDAKSFPVPGCSIRCGVFSRDGKRLILGVTLEKEKPAEGAERKELQDVAGAIFVWNVSDFKPVGRMERQDRAMRDLCLSPDGTRVASTSYDGTIYVWDLPK